MNIIIWTSARTIYIHINVHYWLLASRRGPLGTPVSVAGHSPYCTPVLGTSYSDARKCQIMDHVCCLFSHWVQVRISLLLYFLLEIVGGVEWGGVDRARVGVHPPWGSAGQKRGVIHSWPSLQKVQRGQTVLVCSFFLFLQKCEERREGVGNTGGGWQWGKDELGGAALRRGRRGRGGKTEKQLLKAQLLSPCTLKST